MAWPIQVYLPSPPVMLKGRTRMRVGACWPGGGAGSAARTAGAIKRTARIASMVRRMTNLRRRAVGQAHPAHIIARRMTNGYGIPCLVSKGTQGAGWLSTGLDRAGG